MNRLVGIVYRESTTSRGDLRFSDPPSGQGAGGMARIRDRRVSADIRVENEQICQVSKVNGQLQPARVRSDVSRYLV
ncbi:hypothetical protein PoB_004492300 [Plakobranchus ocellatus]|uniref:Uncharacterized protein n=1 Tax=Plakobranchus ocellatus TaxID=259542 RepID=A0AAV4BHX1_9GAST|nr:hypothetical protein PoB_004492300 [Plakobranchus ocellatus]